MMKTRKLGIMLIATVLLVTMAFAGTGAAIGAYPGSGTVDDPWWCGADTTGLGHESSSVYAWLDGTTLHIAGNGDMYDWIEWVTFPGWYNSISTITDIVIDSGVTSIGNFAFLTYGHTYNSVSLPEGLKKIGEGAFSGGGNTLSQLALPSTVTEIGSGAFRGLQSLSEFTVATGNSKFTALNGILFTKDGTTLVCYPGGNTSKSYTVPNTVTKIANYAFYGAVGLTDGLALHDGITHVGENAFNNYALKLIPDRLPSSLEYIGNGAFSSSNYFENANPLTIPANVSFIGQRAFTGCKTLSFEVDGQNTNYTAVDGVLFSKDVTTLLAYPCANTTRSSSTYTIPETVTEIKGGAFEAVQTKIGTISFTASGSLKTIGDYAFNDCQANIGPLPKTVESIGINAFSNDKHLAEVLIPLDGNLKSIGYAAFTQTGGVKVLNIPASVEYIDSKAFSYSWDIDEFVVAGANPNYKSVDGVLFTKDGKILMNYPLGDSERKTYTVPDGVVTIANYAFNFMEPVPPENRVLTQITLPDSLETIGDSVFVWCENLTGITIPSNVKSIGDYAFQGCYLMKDVVLNEGLETLGYCVFYNCYLDKLEIPASVTSIGGGLFKTDAGSSPMKMVVIKGNTDNIDIALGAFYQGEDAVYYVNTGSKKTDEMQYIAYLNGGKLGSGFIQVEKKLPTADNVSLRDGYVFEEWYDDATFQTRHTGDSIESGSPVYANYKVYKNAETTDITGTATFGKNNVLALQQDPEPSSVSKVVLESVSGLDSGKTVTFVADNTKVGDIPELSGYTKIEDVSIFEINVDGKVSGVATFEVTVTFASPEDAEQYGDQVRFVHYDTTKDEWETSPLESEVISTSKSSIEYRVTTPSFSPFGISVQTKNPEPVVNNRGHTASTPKPSSSSVQPMVQETAKPTTAPTVAAPTMMPTTKPTTQATQKSPAPVAGLVLGLGVAALVLARMRR